jgi:hypothetical protein
MNRLLFQLTLPPTGAGESWAPLPFAAIAASERDNGPDLRQLSAGRGSRSTWTGFITTQGSFAFARSQDVARRRLAQCRAGWRARAYGGATRRVWAYSIAESIRHRVRTLQRRLRQSPGARAHGLRCLAGKPGCLNLSGREAREVRLVENLCNPADRSS